jgi:hypothetical protein
LSHYHPEIKSTAGGATNWFERAYEAIETARDASGIVVYPSGGKKRVIAIVIRRTDSSESPHINVRTLDFKLFCSNIPQMVASKLRALFNTEIHIISVDNKASMHAVVLEDKYVTLNLFHWFSD